MDSTDRLNLQKMINANDVQDQTNVIREKKHSQIIRKEVNQLLTLKKNNSKLAIEHKDKFDELCILNCNFLFANYMDIFNKVKKEEISIDILNKFLDVLSDIENGNVDQHEASFTVGKYLKELYVDSALKRAEKIDKSIEKPEEREHLNISWREYKSKDLNQ